MTFRLFLFALLISSTACSTFTNRRNINNQSDMSVTLKDAKGNKVNAAPSTSEITPDHTQTDDAHAKLKAQLTGEDSTPAHTATAAAATPTSTAHADHGHDHGRHAGPVPAEKSLGWLKNGNTRFIKGKFRSDGASSRDRSRLASGQQPHAVVLSCSDSRVPPEVVFDQKLGEIFVVRAAGQALDEATIASVEYAISHLGSNLLVVMGHDSCGAVKAAHSSLDGKDLGSPHINNLVADIHPRIRQFASQPISADAVPESWANVQGVAKDLMQRSQIIRDAVASGEVKISQALYHLGSGVVEWQE